MFPVHAEAQAMGAPLPRDGFIQMEAASARVVRDRISNHEAGLWNADRRNAKSEAALTVLCARGTGARSDHERGKSQVVDQCGTDDARHANHTLIGAVHDAVPVRGIRVCGSAGDRRCRPKAAARILGVAEKTVCAPLILASSRPLNRVPSNGLVLIRLK